MQTTTLTNLVDGYRCAPKEFQATTYWDAYEREILETIPSIDLRQMRSGRYPILGTFGFHDETYHLHPNMPRWQKVPLKALHRYVFRDRRVLPYHLNVSDIRELAYRHCQLTAEVDGAKPIEEVEVSAFGAPQDLFQVDGSLQPGNSGGPIVEEKTGKFIGVAVAKVGAVDTIGFLVPADSLRRALAGRVGDLDLTVKAIQPNSADLEVKAQIVDIQRCSGDQGPYRRHAALVPQHWSNAWARAGDASAGSRSLTDGVLKQALARLKNQRQSEQNDFARP